MAAEITRMNPPTLPDAGTIGYSQISVAVPGRLAFVSGQVAWRRDGGAVPGTLAAQTAVAIENLKAALAALGAEPDDIVQMRIYVVDLSSDGLDAIMSQLARFLDGARPSLTGIGVAALASPALKVEIEMVVRVPA